ncbi:FAD-dependent oxidoreductase [Pseudomonas sp. P42]|uniref:FAD-dependent oxidoreductase n=1 Tax=Pseudomonas sp. P42 TaxID=1080160 RepID=UPI001B31AC12|nr:FAD-dependent oxidoreductase [Pseudomonas sp. P42]MBP5952247.1 FAD-binding oxidoreductase [Pseudomonas sp. P42]
MKIAVVGAGWNGAHCALELVTAGHQVVLLDKHPDIFQGVSGDFGIRLHKGPHYPRSRNTRESCLEVFDRFRETYPELVVTHDSAIYAQGTRDALGNRSKVSNDAFAHVCHESPECREVDLSSSAFAGLESAFDLDEPSVVLGDRLRSYFRERLAVAGVQIHSGFCVEKIVRKANQSLVYRDDGSVLAFDLVINTTGFQSLLPAHFERDFPFDVEVVYQPCLALCYQDRQPSEKLFSFIVMDGWFPCLMPAITSQGSFPANYILTHGSYTIMGSFPTVAQADSLLEGLTDEFVAAKVKAFAEAEMCRFWPEFSRRFHYTGWKGSVMAKLKTRSEFRSAVTFENEGVIYVFPGKISNVFNAADEVLALIANRSSIEKNGFRYAAQGVLDIAHCEMTQKPEFGEQNTCNLQTYTQLGGRKQASQPQTVEATCH